MKRLSLILVASFVLVASVHAQHQHNLPVAPVTLQPIALLSNIGGLHHPVSTKNVEAQRFFNQGLVLLYAFNEPDAARSFRRAAELDPQLAMAYWGTALALNNSSVPLGAESKKEAYIMIQKAVSMAAPENERAYIEALAKLITANPNADQKKLYTDYVDAMLELHRRYPQDSDAATLYAVSILGERDSIAVLESVLKRDPTHLGANHFYIHAVEDSAQPERALPSAERLRAMKFSSAMVGHLVHMPSHIYMRVGDYNAAARVNEESNALPVDGLSPEFKNLLQMHNSRFQLEAYSMAGRSKDAVEIAKRFFDFKTSIVLVRFRRWNDILKLPVPKQSADTSSHDAMACTPGMAYAGLRLSVDPFPSFSGGSLSWARGMAYAAEGKVREAAIERDNMVVAKTNALEQMAKGASKEQIEVFGHTMSIMENLLRAKIAAAAHDNKTALELLRQAVAAQDALPYTEPAIWYIHARESLGGALLLNNKPAEAEKVFRADLERNRRNGRSLFGLMESLKAQGKRAEAQVVQRQFKEAWEYADVRLRVEDL